MDRLTGMSVFVAAVEEGSLAAAARLHGLSASMAGKHLAAIEAELGVRLVHRSTRSLALTDAGRSFRTRAMRILEEHAEARREAANTQGLVRGRLRIAAPVTYGTMRLAGDIAVFLERYPNVDVEVTLDDRYVDLVAEGIDVAVRIGRLRDSALVARRLGPCRMVLCASPRLIAGVGNMSDAAALRRLPRVAFSDPVSPGDWTLTDPQGLPHAVDGPVRMVANNMEMLLAAALRGVGLAYGPSFVFAQALAAGDLTPVLTDHRTADLAVHAVTSTRTNAPLSLRCFLDQLSASPA